MSTRITAGTVLLVAVLLVGAASAAAPLQLGPSTHKQLALYTIPFPIHLSQTLSHIPASNTYTPVA